MPQKRWGEARGPVEPGGRAGGAGWGVTRRAAAFHRFHSAAARPRANAAAAAAAAITSAVRPRLDPRCCSFSRSRRVPRSRVLSLGPSPPRRRRSPAMTRPRRWRHHGATRRRRRRETGALVRGGSGAPWRAGGETAVSVLHCPPHPRQTRPRVDKDPPCDPHRPDSARLWKLLYCVPSSTPQPGGGGGPRAAPQTGRGPGHKAVAAGGLGLPLPHGVGGTAGSAPHSPQTASPLRGGRWPAAPRFTA